MPNKPLERNDTRKGAPQWCQIRDPFKIPNERHIETVPGRIAAKHGVRIDLPKCSLQIVGWGISDA